MELHERADGLVVINDAYNANPDSMRSALETLARMGSSGRRTVAVLGEMRELGGTAEEEHRQVGLLCRRLGIDVVVVVGPGARAVYDALVEARATARTTRYVETATEAGEWLRENVAGPDVVLVKASRSGRLETVADMLVGDQSDDVLKMGRGRCDESDPPRRRPVPDLHPRRHPLRHPGAVQVRLRPADPRRRTHHPPHQARHAHDGWPGDRARLGAGLLHRDLRHRQPAERVGAAADLPVHGARGRSASSTTTSRSRDSAAWACAAGPRSSARAPWRSSSAVLAISPWLEDSRHRTPAGTAISFIREPRDLTLPSIVLVLFIWLLIAGASNAVNLTDGLDGLAAGASVMTFGAYTIVNIWQNNQWCGRAAGPKCYDVRDPLDLAVIAAAITGACFGFLWWNASPAKIFMGDTGSLALGGALAGLAVLTRTEFLLALLGGLFVIQTLSVILQVGFFKPTKGKRLFRMAPLHHHFEMLGWEEITVVIRFWLIAGIFVAAGLGVFYAEWVAGV